MTTLKEWYLPFTNVMWISEDQLVCAVSCLYRLTHVSIISTQGHDCCPMLFKYAGVDKMSFVAKLDLPSEQKAGKMT